MMMIEEMLNTQGVDAACQHRERKPGDSGLKRQVQARERMGQGIAG